MDEAARGRCSFPSRFSFATMNCEYKQLKFMEKCQKERRKYDGKI